MISREGKRFSRETLPCRLPAVLACLCHSVVMKARGLLCWFLESHRGRGYSGACLAPRWRSWGNSEERTHLLYMPWLSFSCGHFCCGQRASLMELGIELG